mmetsp:Transcript_26378/g.40487  ORF Transcript_26378/g.40487 Transcript_26378/m.40487 type:complete len:228 (-) Transcript_26378:1404-2087(-)
MAEIDLPDVSSVEDPFTATMETSIEPKITGSDMDDETEQCQRSYRPGIDKKIGGATRKLPVNIPTNSHEMRTVSVRYGRESWQVRVLHYVHDRKVQNFLMALLLLDVCILFLELFLAAEFPPCSIIERDAISCCPADNGDHSNGHLMRLLSESSHGDHHNLCEDDSLDMSKSYQAACDDHARPALHKAHNTLFGMTISILSIFLTELCLLIVVLGPRTFFHHFFLRS